MEQPLLISDLIVHAANVHGDTEVMSVDPGGDIEYTTWAKVEKNARKLASALLRLGIAEETRCATIAWNNRRHLEIYFGVSGSGLVCHTLNPRLAPESLVYIINHAEDRVLFVDISFLALVSKIRSSLKTVEYIVLMGSKPSEPVESIDGLIFYDDLVVDGDASYLWPSFEESRPSSLCYTSGTTGDPKGVLYSHRSTVLHSLAGNQPDGLGVSARDTVLPVVPMFHVNAWGVPYVAAAQGAKLVLPGPHLDGPSLVKLINQAQVTVALGVPTIWLGLLGALRASGAKIDSLKRTIIGGSALPPSIVPIFRDEYGVELVHAWGMTETSPLGTVNQPLAKHAEWTSKEVEHLRLNQGRPPFGVSLRVVDAQGHELPRDGKTQGALQIRGHWVVDTYFGEETSACTENGWYNTGDVAVLDENGYMTIKDRMKDVIKSGGEWISSVELENIAIGHPAVKNAAAIAAIHPKWDERPVVVVVTEDNASLSESELLEFYSGKIPNWQIPDRILLVEQLPLGGTGKVLKKTLRAQFQNVLIENA